MNNDIKSSKISPIEEIIEEARNGKMYILVDDPDRENEGDLIVPAQMATPDAINFMAKHGRGLICLSMTKQRIEELNLPLMNPNNQKNDLTAFTISIEAKEGITTGISAADRSHTISVAINHNRNKNDLVSPGHVFPLMAWDGGVLVRAGHTEAAVDISKLAGLNPSAVICEIMSEDGSMARLPDLLKVAKKFNLKIISIKDLISYRLRNETLIKREDEITLPTEHGNFKLIPFRQINNNQIHLALKKGDWSSKDEVLVRVHSSCITGDILGSLRCDCGSQLKVAMKMINENKREFQWQIWILITIRKK